MRKIVNTLSVFVSVFLFAAISQAAILPPLNGTFVLVEQSGSCFRGVGPDASMPLNLEIVSNDVKLLPAYVLQDGSRHIINYSMRVGIFDQRVFGGAGVFRRVGEYSPDMKTFVFSEFSLPNNPTGFEKPQSITKFEIDQDDALIVSEPIAGWTCKFVRK